MGWTLPYLQEVVTKKLYQDVIKEAKEIRKKYKYIVFSGMGGSGLSVQLAKDTFGEPQGIKIISLRTTDPAVIADIVDNEIIEAEGGNVFKALKKTKVIVVSKSGTTQETKSHQEHFEKLYQKYGVDTKGHFTLVTDPGSPMEAEAQQKDYNLSYIQLNKGKDIGGRFTAPGTRVFLLPLAVINPEKVSQLLERTVKSVDFYSPQEDPYLQLAAYLFYQAKEAKRDKVTFIVPKELQRLPLWAEQLIEESLGKEGKGITIFYNEYLHFDDNGVFSRTLNPVDANDRVFVRFNMSDVRKTNDDFVSELKEKGYPVFDITVEDNNLVRALASEGIPAYEIDAYDYVGSIMFGLQRMVAAIGWLWDITFVDQPGVDGYKKGTRKVLQDMKEAGVDKVEMPKNWKFADYGTRLKVYYTPLIEAGVMTESEIEQEVKGLGSDMKNGAAVYAALINIARKKGNFEAAELASYGRMSNTFLFALVNARSRIFSSLLKMPAKIAEGPDKNHSFQQNIAKGKNMFFSTYFLPLETTQSKYLEYDLNPLLAQAIGTVQSLAEEGRKAVLITIDGKISDAEESTEDFFADVERYLVKSQGTAASAITMPQIGIVDEQKSTEGTIVYKGAFDVFQQIVALFKENKEFAAVTVNSKSATDHPMTFTAAQIAQTEELVKNLMKNQTQITVYFADKSSLSLEQVIEEPTSPRSAKNRWKITKIAGQGFDFLDEGALPEEIGGAVKIPENIQADTGADEIVDRIVAENIMLKFTSNLIGSTDMSEKPDHSKDLKIFIKDGYILLRLADKAKYWEFVEQVMPVRGQEDAVASSSSSSNIITIPATTGRDVAEQLFEKFGTYPLALSGKLPDGRIMPYVASINLMVGSINNITVRDQKLLDDNKIPDEKYKDWNIEKSMTTMYYGWQGELPEEIYAWDKNGTGIFFRLEGDSYVEYERHGPQYADRLIRLIDGYKAQPGNIEIVIHGLIDLGPLNNAPGLFASPVEYSDFMVKKSIFARDIAKQILNPALKNQRDLLIRATEERIAKNLGTTMQGQAAFRNVKGFIEEWLNPSSGVPQYVRQGLLRAMLEQRIDDVIVAYQAWREFGTAGIRGNAVISKYPDILKQEGKEFVEDPQAPILSGPNGINAPVLLQQVAAISKIMHELRDKLLHNPTHKSVRDMDEGLKERILKNRIALAYDSRLNGEYFATIIAAAFLKNGINADLFDSPSGVPGLVWGANAEGFSDIDGGSVFGVLISASHSEWFMNGFKAFLASLLAQVDQKNKDKIMNAREELKYSDMNLDLLKETTEETFINAEKIFQESDGQDGRATLRWLGRVKKHEGKDYFGKQHIDFYAEYFKRIKNRAPSQKYLPEEMKKKVMEARAKLDMRFSGFYGVGAETVKARGANGTTIIVPGVNFPDFFRSELGYEQIKTVKEQTDIMNGMFPSHPKQPDPGDITGWVSNFLDAMIQEAGADFSDLEKTITMINQESLWEGTDPDVDRLGIMIALLKGVKGNMKDRVLKAVQQYLEKNPELFKGKEAEIMKALTDKLYDKLLLTANEAWEFIAYYVLEMMEQNGHLDKETVYFLEKSHVTTSGLERVAQKYRKKGYKVYVVDTWVGFTEIGATSNSIFMIAKRVSELSRATSGREALIKSIKADLDALKDMNPEETVAYNEKGDRDTFYAFLEKTIDLADKKFVLKQGLGDEEQLLQGNLNALSRAYNLMGVEESNGYGEMGHLDPIEGKVVDKHIYDKDGGLAGVIFPDLLSWGSVLSMSPYDMYKKMGKELGRTVTENLQIRYPGFEGTNQKFGAIEILEKVFAVAAQKALDLGTQASLFNGKFKVTGVMVFRAGKYDNNFRGLPEEGVRPIVEIFDENGNSLGEGVVTFRPSGTGDSNRVYDWYLSVPPKPSEDWEDYRARCDKITDVMRESFWGVEADVDAEFKGKAIERYSDRDPSEFYGLLLSLKQEHINGYQAKKDVDEAFDAMRLSLGKAMGQNGKLYLSENEEKLLGVVRAYTFADRKHLWPSMKPGYRADDIASLQQARTENRTAWDEYIKSQEAKDYLSAIRQAGKEKTNIVRITIGDKIALQIPKAIVIGFKAGLVDYLSMLLSESALLPSSLVSSDEELFRLVNKRFAREGWPVQRLVNGFQSVNISLDDLPSENNKVQFKSDQPDAGDPVYLEVDPEENKVSIISEGKKAVEVEDGKGFVSFTNAEGDIEIAVIREGRNLKIENKSNNPIYEFNQSSKFAASSTIITQGERLANFTNEIMLRGLKDNGYDVTGISFVPRARMIRYANNLTWEKFWNAKYPNPGEIFQRIVIDIQKDSKKGQFLIALADSAELQIVYAGADSPDGADENLKLTIEGIQKRFKAREEAIKTEPKVISPTLKTLTRENVESIVKQILDAADSHGKPLTGGIAIFPKGAAAQKFDSTKKLTTYEEFLSAMKKGFDPELSVVSQIDSISITFDKTGYAAVRFDMNAPFVVETNIFALKPLETQGAIKISSVITADQALQKAKSFIREGRVTMGHTMRSAELIPKSFRDDVIEILPDELLGYNLEDFEKVFDKLVAVQITFWEKGDKNNSVTVKLDLGPNTSGEFVEVLKSSSTLAGQEDRVEGYRPGPGKLSNRIVAPSIPELPEGHRVPLKGPSYDFENGERVGENYNTQGTSSALEVGQEFQADGVKALQRIADDRGQIPTEIIVTFSDDDQRTFNVAKEGSLKNIWEQVDGNDDIRSVEAIFGDPSVKTVIISTNWSNSVWKVKERSSAPGGILMSSEGLDLQIKRDGNGIPLPMSQQPIESMNIQGFSFEIMGITPVPSLFLLSGLSKEDKGGDLTRDTSETMREPVDRQKISYKL